MQVGYIIVIAICLILVARIGYLLYKVNKELNDIYEEMR